MTITPIAVYFLYFIFSRPDSQLCTPQDRSDTCMSDDFGPVCALYTGDNCRSSTGFCTKTLTSPCACNDDTIIGYTPGACNEPTLPHVCKKKERGLSCSEEEDEPVCGYAKPQRFRGQSTSTFTLTNSCEACNADQVVFHVPGNCDADDSMRICRNHRNTVCSEEQEEPLCAYYTGDDCTEKMCRRTKMNSCNVCQESNVLFYVKGACEGSSNDEVRPADELEDVEPQEDIPMLDVEEVGFPVVVPEVIEEVIPELEAVLKEDGTLTYEDLKTLQQSVELTEADCIEPQENIPELEAVIQYDGSVTYEEVRAPQEGEEVVDVDCIVEQQDDIPELEAVLQDDGSVVYEEVQKVDEPVEVDCIVEEQLDIPELEAVLQADGSTIYEEVKPVQEDEAHCVHEEQFNIPELEAVVQADGSVVYEEVATLTVSEETLVTVEEEKAEPAPFLVEVIESRFLVNEPNN